MFVKRASERESLNNSRQEEVLESFAKHKGLTATEIKRERAAKYFENGKWLRSSEDTYLGDKVKTNEVTRWKLAMTEWYDRCDGDNQEKDFLKAMVTNYVQPLLKARIMAEIAESDLKTYKEMIDRAAALVMHNHPLSSRRIVNSWEADKYNLSMKT
jgi:hypothetical protein